MEQLIKNPDSASVRLFFAKENSLSNIWHMCDAAIARQTPDGLEVMALHGRFIHPTDRCDTVLQARIRVGETDVFCQRCLDEYALAKDIIDAKGLMQWK